MASNERKGPWIELSQDDDREWSWVLWAANGRALAVSARDYKRRNDAMRSAERSGELLTSKEVETLADA